MPISAKVIAHSISACKNRELITFEIELHRYVLAEFNTHRMFSRNFQSSRAIPTLKQIRLIFDDPALPVHWGSNNAGMSSKTQFGPVKTKIANGFRRFASYIAIGQAMFEHHILGVHKQWTNRLLEPFMFTKGVFTTNKEGLSNFLALRLAPDAQPEIRELARLIHSAYLCSEPEVLTRDMWHLPYTTKVQRNGLSIEQLIRISASNCAAVSYRPPGHVDVVKVWSMLGLEGDSPNVHASPAEHQAQLVPGSKLGGNFGNGWTQFRKTIKSEMKGDFI